MTSDGTKSMMAYALVGSNKIVPQLEWHLSFSYISKKLKKDYALYDLML